MLVSLLSHLHKMQFIIPFEAISVPSEALAGRLLPSNLGYVALILLGDLHG